MKNKKSTQQSDAKSHLAIFTMVWVKYKPILFPGMKIILNKQSSFVLVSVTGILTSFQTSVTY